MHERHCKHCGYWYPADDWHEDEDHVRKGGGEPVMTIRTVECPGCHAIHDALAPPLRRLAPDEDHRAER